MKLNSEARNAIKWSGTTIAGYTRHYYGDAEWGGDACGCVDDRCIGYHHDELEACRCVDVWIKDMLRDEARDRVLRDLAAVRQRDATPLFPTGLHSFAREQLVELRDAFAAAVDEHDARWNRASLSDRA